MTAPGTCSRPARVAASIAARAPIPVLLVLAMFLWAPACPVASPRLAAAVSVPGAPTLLGGGDGDPGGCDSSSPCGNESHGLPGVGNLSNASQAPATLPDRNSPANPAPSSTGGGVIGWIQNVFTSDPPAAPASGTGQHDRPAATSTTSDVAPDPKSDSAGSADSSLWSWLTSVVQRQPAQYSAPRGDQDGSGTAHGVKHPQGDAKDQRAATDDDPHHTRLFELLGLLLVLAGLVGAVSFVGLTRFFDRDSRRPDGPADGTEGADQAAGAVEAAGPVEAGAPRAAA